MSRFEELIIQILKNKRYSEVKLLKVFDGFFVRIKVRDLFSDVLYELCKEIEDLNYKITELEMDPTSNIVELIFRPINLNHL